jgi:hypothetical protein
MRKLLWAALIGTLVFIFAAHAADITGKWTAEVSAKGAGLNSTLKNTFTFKVEGKKLTGSTNVGFGDDAEIRDGKIDGDRISFTAFFSFGAGATYEGKVSGDTIKFSRNMEGEDYGTQPALFTATRVK